MNTLTENWKVEQGVNRQPELHDFMMWFTFDLL